MSKKVVIAVIGAAFVTIGVVILLPAFMRARSTSASDACRNNLRHIVAAKKQWAIEERKTTNDTPTWDDLRAYIGRNESTGAVLRCPDGGTYVLGQVGELPKCSLAPFEVGGKSHVITE